MVPRAKLVVSTPSSLDCTYALVRYINAGLEPVTIRYKYNKCGSHRDPRHGIAALDPERLSTTLALYVATKSHASDDCVQHFVPSIGRVFFVPE